MYLIERRDNLMRSLEKNGRRIGTKDFGDVWVQDGKVYIIDATTCGNLGDYYDFCEAVRTKKHPDFYAVNNFHIGPKKVINKMFDVSFFYYTDRRLTINVDTINEVEALKLALEQLKDYGTKVNEWVTEPGFNIRIQLKG